MHEKVKLTPGAARGNVARSPGLGLPHVYGAAGGGHRARRDARVADALFTFSVTVTAVPVVTRLLLTAIAVVEPGAVVAARTAAIGE